MQNENYKEDLKKLQRFLKEKDLRAIKSYENEKMNLKKIKET